MYSYKRKVALVTGSATGIGKAILISLAKKGCTVILHYYKDSSNAKKTIKELREHNVNASFYSADLTKENSVKNLFNKVKTTHKKIDILVNNVGNYIKKPLSKLETKEWHYIIDSNLHATYYCTHYGLPLIRKSKQGRIINIGYASTGQMVAKPSILPYQISKTGILLMTKAFAVNEAKNNILINMVSPGVMENSVSYPKKEIPLKKQGSLLGLSKVVIDTIESEYTTGAHIEYAGGFNL